MERTYWIARDERGYHLHGVRPKLCRLRGTERRQFFPRYGDPVDVAKLCVEGTQAALGSGLGMHQMARVRISMELVTEPMTVEPQD